MAHERTSSAKRGYNARWQKARATYLRSHPMCVMHEARGLLVAAEVVDHIVPHKGDSNLFWDQTNWQSLCKHCHDSHKQALERGSQERGCDVNGLPLSGSHHWKHFPGAVGG